MALDETDTQRLRVNSDSSSEESTLRARPPRVADLEHPWLGLDSFREEDRDYFFGRDAEIAEVHLRLRSNPLLVLYSRSGLGKTSVLKAGLVPRLRAEHYHPVLERLRYETDAASPCNQILLALFGGEGDEPARVSSAEVNLHSVDYLATRMDRLRTWEDEVNATPAFPMPDDAASRLWLRLHWRKQPPNVTHLILDQFEEVFTLGARLPGTESEVRDALAILLQGAIPEPISRLIAEYDTFVDCVDPDSTPVRVVLALRDDYVYALNRWKRHIPGLGQNNFELRALRGPDALKAVFKPGELRCHYRGQVSDANRADTGLPPIISEETAQRIVRFVANKPEDVPIDDIEAVPPILSLLCRELNARRFTEPEGTPEKPAAQIVFREGENDIKSIIAAFYERCLSGRPAAVRIFIEEELVSYSGGRLQQDEKAILSVFEAGCEIPGAADGRRAEGYGNVADARACLDDLVNQRLLTPVAGDRPTYELIHDLLAGVAETSRVRREQTVATERANLRAESEKKARDDAEARARAAHRLARRGVQTAILTVFLAVAAFGGLIEHQRSQKLVGWQSGGALEELRRLPEKEQRDLAPSRFDIVAAYYLWQAPEKDRMDRLSQVLQKYEELLPPDYGIPPGEDVPQPSTPWPIEISYAQDRFSDSDTAGFAGEWRRLAKDVATEWGFPVPARVYLVGTETLRGDTVVAGAPGVTEVKFDVPRYEAQCLVLLPPEGKELPPRVGDFRTRFKGEWKELMQLDSNALSRWSIVPRWSLPVWKACNRPAKSGGSIVAIRVMQHLLEGEPQVLVSDEASHLLLRRVAKRYPSTVAEAEAARGKRLPADLASLVRKGRPLFVLPEILDGDAERWDLDSDDIANEVDKGLWMTEEARIPARLHGPWKEVVGEGLESEAGPGAVDPYAEVLAYLPPVESEIRVSTGRELIASWFPRNLVSDELRNALEELRRRYYRRQGVWLPGVRFRDGTFEVPTNSVRIEILGERPDEDGPEAVTLDGPDKVAQFVEELESVVDLYRGYWLTAESVEALLQDLPPGLQAWLKKTYSVTDLKILLRGVSAPERARASAPEATARHPDWLLASLVGWATLGDPLNPREMRDHLLETQAARLGSAPPADAATAEVESGVRALVGDRIGEAVESFEKAKKNPSAASKAFLLAWAKAFQQAWVTLFEVKHPDLNRLQLSVADRLDLEDVLAAPATALSADARWRALLYSLAASEGKKRFVPDPQERRRRMRELLEAPGPADSRSPANARWLALEFLTNYDATRDDPAHFNAAAGLLESASKRLDAKQRLSTFGELQQIAIDAAADKRLWDLAAKLATNAPPDVLSSVQLEFASTLCSRERKGDAERAITLLAEYEKLLGQAPASQVSDLERDWRKRLIRSLQACARHSLARFGEPWWGESERLYRETLGLSGGKRDGIASNASFGLISLLQERGRLHEADALLRDARRDWPEEFGFQNLALVSAFAHGDAGAVAAVAREALAKADELGTVKSPDEKRWLGVATWGALTTGMDGWEKVAERYADAGTAGESDDIRLHLATRQAELEPARAPALFQRWEGADPASWDRRLREGDSLVFNEMLAGRWIERPESRRLLDILESEEAWEKSPLPYLSSTRRAQRSEAWLLEARRAAAAGDTKRRIECLRRCIAAHATSNWEYWEAVFLLAEERAR